MRAMWTGSISWGLVVLPIKLGAAVTDNSVSFKQMHGPDGGHIKLKRICTVCGDEVPFQDLAKGFQHSKDNITVLTEADMAGLPLPTAKTISVIKFVPADQIDPLSNDHVYFMWPDGPSSPPAYALLRDTMRETSKVAICKIMIRTRERMAVLSVRGNSLMLTTLLWADEVREPDWEVPEGGLSDEAKQMARQLIEQSSGDFKPGDYQDGFRAALEALIEAKASGTTPAETETTPKPAELDLNAALKASLKPAAKQRAKPKTAAKPKTRARTKAAV